VRANKHLGSCMTTHWRLTSLNVGEKIPPKITTCYTHHQVNLSVATGNMKCFSTIVGGLPQQHKRYHASRNQSSQAVINSFTTPQEYWHENEQFLFSVFCKVWLCLDRCSVVSTNWPLIWNPELVHTTYVTSVISRLCTLIWNTVALLSMGQLIIALKL
jgi:hypothetical protein